MTNLKKKKKNAQKVSCFYPENYPQDNDTCSADALRRYVWRSRVHCYEDWGLDLEEQLGELDGWVGVRLLQTGRRDRVSIGLSAY